MWARSLAGVPNSHRNFLFVLSLYIGGYLLTYGMKALKIMALPCLVLFASACNNKPADHQTNISTADSSKVKLPYTKSSQYNWEFNKDPKNEAVVLNVFKAMENLDYKTIGGYTADSLESNIDGVKFNGTRAQIMQLNKDFFAGLKTLKVVPQDWRSVINQDKTEEWVSVWFSQYWEDRTGKRDSLKVFNDIRLKNGRITAWNEYIQHFPR